MFIKVLGLYKQQPSSQFFRPIKECLVIHSEDFSIVFFMVLLRVIGKSVEQGGLLKPLIP
jgi:hypothetical protein